MAGKTINAWGETWATPGKVEQSPNDTWYDEDPFVVVPAEYRNRVFRKARRNYSTRTSPLIDALINGHTVLVDANIPTGRTATKYKNLHATMSARGYRLRTGIIDDIDRDIFRGVLMWAEPMIVLWNCSRCDEYRIESEDSRPQVNGCAVETKLNADHYGNIHSWRRFSKKSKPSDLKRALSKTVEVRTA